MRENTSQNFSFYDGYGVSSALKAVESSFLFRFCMRCFYKYLIWNPWREFMFKNVFFLYILFIFFGGGDMLTYMNHNFKSIYGAPDRRVDETAREALGLWHVLIFMHKVSRGKCFRSNESGIENCPKVKIIYWERLNVTNMKCCFRVEAEVFGLSLCRLKHWVWMLEW